MKSEDFSEKSLQEFVRELVEKGHAAMVANSIYSATVDDSVIKDYWQLRKRKLLGMAMAAVPAGKEWHVRVDEKWVEPKWFEPAHLRMDTVWLKIEVCDDTNAWELLGFGRDLSMLDLMR